MKYSPFFLCLLLFSCVAESRQPDPRFEALQAEVEQLKLKVAALEQRIIHPPDDFEVRAPSSIKTLRISSGKKETHTAMQQAPTQPESGIFKGQTSTMAVR